MVKIKNKKRLKWALKRYENSNSDQQQLAFFLGVTTRRFRQLYTEYKTTGKIPIVGCKIGRPKKAILRSYWQLIVEKYDKYLLNALYLEKVIYAENNIRIPHNTIHKVLLEEGLAKREPNKSKRRKPWIMYERDHSLSAGHLDWHEPEGGPKVCVVLDDASRKVLAGGEFDNSTEENSRKLVQEVIDKYGYIKVLREAITDHGSQFYANKRDKEGYANHGFEQFLKRNGVKHILCRYKHPQSNGKVEKWFDLYRIHRKRFKTFKEFIEWYNNRPHGSLNLRRAETPEQAFWRKMPEEYYFNLAKKFFRW
jgi:putative transposase